MLEDLTAKYSSSHLMTFPFDVPSISTAFNQAISHFNRVDVVLNNAGYYIVSEAEGIPHKAAREMFDVLPSGAENVMCEAIRCFRDVNRPMGERPYEKGRPGIKKGGLLLEVAEKRSSWSDSVYLRK